MAHLVLKLEMLPASVKVESDETLITFPLHHASQVTRWQYGVAPFRV